MIGKWFRSPTIELTYLKVDNTNATCFLQWDEPILADFFFFYLKFDDYLFLKEKETINGL